MRKLFVLIFALTAIGAISACRAKVANTAANDAATVVVSPFAGITDANAAMTEGDRLLDDNQTELAIEAYKRAVEINANLGEAYFKMGIAYALLESEAAQNGAAERLPGDVVEKLPKTNSEKMFAKAIEVYRRQLDGSAKDASAYFNLGRAYNKLNKDEDAEKALEQAVKLKPDDSEFLTELGAIRVKLAKYHEAIASLKKAIEIDPENAEAIDLLDDAEAGAKRVDYVSQKPNANNLANNSNRASNSNANVAANTASNSVPSGTPSKPPANTVRPSTRDAKTPERQRVVRPN